MQIVEKHSTKDETHHLWSALAAHGAWKLRTTSLYFGAKFDGIKRTPIILPMRGTNGEIQTDGKYLSR